MKSKIFHTANCTAFDPNVVRNLPTNGVAVEAVDCYPLQHHIFAVVQKNRAPNIAIEIGIRLLVSGENEVTHDNPTALLGFNQRVRGDSLRILAKPVVDAWHAVQSQTGYFDAYSYDRRWGFDWTTGVGQEVKRFHSSAGGGWFLRLWSRSRRVLGLRGRLERKLARVRW